MELLYACSKPHGKQHPEWSKNAVIYELNTRQFSAEGTFGAVIEQLPRLRQLGVDIIWMMPIFPIGQERRKGSLGSYYSIQDYCAVNPEFGTMDDFRRLVDKAHETGLKIILDWVPNHTSRDAVWTHAHPEWYVWDEEKNEIATPWDWNDTAQLNYANVEMRAAMVEAMKFWLKEADIDGFRVDMAMLEPIEFWNDTTPQLEAIRPDLFMLAEAEGPHFHDRAFDASYGWAPHHLLVDIAQGRANAHDLRALLRHESLNYPTEAMRMMFTSNHDENTWSGSEFDRFGVAAKQMAALTFILPGIPMLYNGQEVGSSRSLAFFDKDLVEWNQPNDMTELYSELCALRHTNRALWSAPEGGNLWTINNTRTDVIFSVKRRVGQQIVIGLFNFSSEGVDTEITDDDFNGEFRQIGNNAMASLRSGQHFYLPSHSYFVYYR